MRRGIESSRARVLAGLLVVAALMMLGGCVWLFLVPTTSEMIRAKTTSDEGVTLPPPPVAGHGKAITIVRPSDARSLPGSIGRDIEAESNGFGGGFHLETTYSSPQGSVPVWIGNSFASGLESAGFRVEKATALSASSTPLTLKLTVKEVWVDMGPNVTSPLMTGRAGRCRISIDAELYNRKTRVARRIYGGRFEASTAAPFSSDTLYSELLEGALKDMMSRAIPDLAGVIVREPV